MKKTNLSLNEVLNLAMNCIVNEYEKNDLDLWNIAYCNKDRIQVIMIFQDEPESMSRHKINEKLTDIINAS